MSNHEQVIASFTCSSCGGTYPGAAVLERTMRCGLVLLACKRGECQKIVVGAAQDANPERVPSTNPSKPAPLEWDDEHTEEELERMIAEQLPTMPAWLQGDE